MQKQFLTPTDIKLAKFSMARELKILKEDITDKEACDWIKHKSITNEDFVAFLYEIPTENLIH